MDVAVFCLALMGTDYPAFLREAHRVLRPGGRLWIAEVQFVPRLCSCVSGADMLSGALVALCCGAVYDCGCVARLTPQVQPLPQKSMATIIANGSTVPEVAVDSR